MEGKKQGGSKNSSFTSPGIFGSMFEPSCKVLGKASVRIEERKPSSINEAPKLKPATFGEILKILEAGNHRYFHQEPPADPCYMSSSIYYGGPDIIPQQQSHWGQSVEFNTAQMSYGGEDDSGAATVGNWWLGSLYY